MVSFCLQTRNSEARLLSCLCSFSYSISAAFWRLDRRGSVGYSCSTVSKACPGLALLKVHSKLSVVYRVFMLLATWPLLRAFRLSSHTILITKERLTVLQMWGMEVSGNETGKSGFYSTCTCAGSCDSYGPVIIDSWRCPCAYVCMVGDSLISNWRAWRNIWENQVRRPYSSCPNSKLNPLFARLSLL